MKGFVTVTGKDEGCEAGLRNLNAELLFQLPDQALLWGFSGINLTTRKFPEPGERFTNRSLSYENPPVRINECGRRHQNERLFRSLRCVHEGERYTPRAPLSPI